MTFQRVRQFPTGDEGLLARALERFEEAVQRAFTDADRDYAPRWKPVRVTTTTVTARPGDLLICADELNVVVVPPRSSTSDIGSSFRVLAVSGTVNIIPDDGESVQGTTFDVIDPGSGTVGWREYQWGGPSVGWWRPV